MLIPQPFGKFNLACPPFLCKCSLSFKTVPSSSKFPDVVCSNCISLVQTLYFEWIVRGCVNPYLVQLPDECDEKTPSKVRRIEPSSTNDTSLSGKIIPSIALGECINFNLMINN